MKKKDGTKKNTEQESTPNSLIKQSPITDCGKRIWDNSIIQIIFSLWEINTPPL